MLLELFLVRFYAKPCFGAAFELDKELAMFAG